jgi:quercetin dioxygenase-like cupin family protein
MEENFFVLKGKVEFVIDGESHIGEKGDFFSMEPKESHYLRNIGNDEAVIVFFLAPFVDGDKVNVIR